MDNNSLAITNEVLNRVLLDATRSYALFGERQLLPGDNGSFDLIFHSVPVKDFSDISRVPYFCVPLHSDIRPAPLDAGTAESMADLYNANPDFSVQAAFRNRSKVHTEAGGLARISVGAALEFFDVVSGADHSEVTSYGDYLGIWERDLASMPHNGSTKLDYVQRQKDLIDRILV